MKFLIEDGDVRERARVRVEMRRFELLKGLAPYLVSQ